jgi:recombinational DNA repair protein (RecF pathway)
MPLRESEAIILQSYPMGEGDRLMSFLSRREGRIRGVAAGARKPKTKFGSTLEPLSYIRIWFFERETRELVRITQSELIESFMALYSDYPTSVVLALFCEITEGVLPDREPSDPAFRLLLLATQSIKKDWAHRIAAGVLRALVGKIGWLAAVAQGLREMPQGTGSRACVFHARALGADLREVPGAGNAGAFAGCFGCGAQNRGRKAGTV